MRYRDNIDYLFASIMYLGTHTFWWGFRSPFGQWAENSA